MYVLILPSVNIIHADVPSLNTSFHFKHPEIHQEFIKKSFSAAGVKAQAEPVDPGNTFAHFPPTC